MIFPKLAAAVLAVAAFLAPAEAQQNRTPRDVVGAAFALAMQDIGSGRPARAVPLLRGILARDPGLVRVRLELARAYYDLREFAQARTQLQIALSAPELPAAVRENVLAFLRRIDEARGLRTDFRFSLERPSGAGRRYETDTVMLDLLGVPLPFKLDRPEAPAAALQIGANARRQWRLGVPVLGARSSPYLRGRVEVQEARGTDFDRQELEIAAGNQLTWARQTAFAEVLTGATWRAEQLQDTQVGLGFGYQRVNARGRVLFARGTISRFEAGEGSARDGALFSLTGGISRPFGGLGSLEATLGLERMEARRGDFSYLALEARLTHSVDVEGGFSMTSSVFAETFRQDEPAPGFASFRDEAGYGVDLRVEKNDLFLAKRYTPYVELGLAHRESSIRAYSYDETSVGIGLSSAF